MPVVSKHAQGMPCWIDASVGGSTEREALIDFYSALFGWRFDVDAPETGFYSIARDDGHAVLGIGEQPGGLGQWVTYFSTTDIEKASQRVKENGGQVFFPPMQVMDVGWMALVLDPTGAVHGLWQPITFPGFEVVNEVNAAGWFDHVSENPQAASRYYEKVLGSEVNTLVQDEMRILRRGEEWFASFTRGDSAEQKPQWTPVFVVDSLDRVVAKARALGAKIIVENVPVPGSAISTFQDPVVGSYVTLMAAGADSGN